MLIALAKRKLLWSTGAFLCMASFWAITPESQTPVESSPRIAANMTTRTDGAPTQPKTPSLAKSPIAPTTANVKPKYVSGVVHPVVTPGGQMAPYVVGTVARTISPTVRQIPTLVADYLIRNCLQIFETEPQGQPVVNHAVSQDRALALHDALSRDSGREPNQALSVATGVVKQHNPVAKKAKQVRARVSGGNLI